MVNCLFAIVSKAVQSCETSVSHTQPKMTSTSSVFSEICFVGIPQLCTSRAKLLFAKMRVWVKNARFFKKSKASSDW